MNNTRKALTVLGAGALLCASLVAAVSVGASDHLDAPGVKADGRTDLNDLYAFQSPANPDNAVLVMTVNPLAGLQNGTTFHPKAKYFFNIDNDGDAVEDTVVKVQFGKVKADGTQQMHVDVSGPNGSAAGNGTAGQTIAISGGGRATAGTYDDPFFFDLEGFKNGFAFDGTDFFAGLNVSAIVVELPRSLLGSGTLGIWSQTWLQGKTVDQVGRPAINTALIASDRKDAFNTTPPSQQWEQFGAEVTAAIAGLSGDPVYAAAVAQILVPDLLTVDFGDPGGFLNGRRLADDVIDVELGVLSKGAVTTDGVGANDAAFSSSFPYLAAAH
jgi:hypothetical protein